MKSTLLFVALMISTLTYSQKPDYSIAQAGDYVLGVYLFLGCDPVNNYDYVGKIDRFDVFETDRKNIEKIIKKARKKNPYFNGMIFKRNFKHVELIRFTDTEERVAGFGIGDQITYSKHGKLYKGKVISLDDAKLKAKIEYFDENGDAHLEKVAIKNLTKHN